MLQDGSAGIVSKEAVDYMTERIGTKWESPEIEHKVKGVMAFSPDRETSIPFDGDGYMLNRKLLPERQNQRCKNMGIIDHAADKTRN